MHLTGGARGRTDPNTASSAKHTHSLTYSLNHTHILLRRQAFVPLPLTEKKEMS